MGTWEFFLTYSFERILKGIFEPLKQVKRSFGFVADGGFERFISVQYSMYEIILLKFIVYFCPYMPAPYTLYKILGQF